MVTRHQSRKKKILSSSRRRQSRVPPLSLDGSDPTSEGEGGSRSVPNTPDSVGMEPGRDGTGESDSGNVHSPASRTTSVPEATPQRSKVRLSGSFSLPLVIEERVGEVEEGERNNMVGEGQLRLRQSPSPSLQVPPSPVRGPSPNTSPRNTRATRVATRRRRSRCERV